MKKLAKDAALKDLIHLDFGYGCHESWQFAKVERINQSKGLFDDSPRVNVTARYGDEIITASFELNEQVELYEPTPSRSRSRKTRGNR